MSFYASHHRPSGRACDTLSALESLHPTRLMKKHTLGNYKYFTQLANMIFDEFSSISQLLCFFVFLSGVRVRGEPGKYK